MRLASASTLLLAAVLAGPALWQAFVLGDLPPDEALTRYLFAVIVAAIMIATLRGITRPYRERAAERAMLEARRNADPENPRATGNRASADRREADRNNPNTA